MRKSLTLLLSFVLILTVAAGAWAAPSPAPDNVGDIEYDAGVLVFAEDSAFFKEPSSLSGGKSTGQNSTVAATTIEIRSASDLANFRNRVNGGETTLIGELMNDIDLGDGTWTPIGTNTNLFNGEFYGNGFCISGLRVNTGTDGAGLFGAADGAYIADFTVKGSVQGSNFVGGIVGIAKDTHIINCGNEAAVTGTGHSVGGIIGSIGYENDDSIVNGCYNKGNITGGQDQEVSYFIGGIVGGSYTSTTDIFCCYNTGTIKGNFASGIAGANSGSLNTCYNAGSITEYLSNEGAGGIAGYNADTGVIDTVYLLSGVAEATSLENDGQIGEHSYAAPLEYFRSQEFLDQLNDSVDGTAFIRDINNINNGMAILGWQIAGFWDVPEKHWAYSNIYYLVDQGILNGKTAHTFEPDNRITRAEFAKVLTSCVEVDLTKYEGYTNFSDVGKDKWYTPFINFAYEAEVVMGNNGRFNPDNPITRQEMAVMINRFAENVAEIELPKLQAPVAFNDQGKIANWATQAVSVMQQAGIINGYTDGTFRPTNNATRAEASKMVHVFYDLWEE